MASPIATVLLMFSAFVAAAPAAPDGCTPPDTGSGGAPAVCGNAIAEDGEECDGSDLRATPECNDLDRAYIGGRLSCDSACHLVLDACVRSVCGDGKGQGIEQCDGADLRDLSSAECKVLSPYYTSGRVTCSADCRYDFQGCVEPRCGDGIIDSNEMCEGANMGAWTGKDCVDVSNYNPPFRPYYSSGALRCVNCQLDQSACVLAPGCAFLPIYHTPYCFPP
jgi:hypothetical protein